MFDLTTTAKSGHATKLKVDGKFLVLLLLKALIIAHEPQVISHTQTASLEAFPTLVHFFKKDFYFDDDKKVQSSAIRP